MYNNCIYNTISKNDKQNYKGYCYFFMCYNLY